MAHDVFISYASEDKTVADAVCAMVESQGVRCWIAPRDVLPGVAYGEAIIDAIHGSRIMVLIFSSKANASPHIPKEIERAASRGVAVLPFRIEAVSPGKSLDYFIGSVHWLDAFTPPLDGHVKRLAENVKTLLSRGAPPTEAIPPMPISAPVAAAPPVAPVSAVPPSVAPPASMSTKPAVGLYVALGGLVLLVLALCFWFVVRPKMQSSTSQVATAPALSASPTSNPGGADASQPGKSPSAGESSGSVPATPRPAAANGAQLYNQGISSYKNQDFSTAANLWQQACEAGEPKGCFGVGVMYEDGRGVSKSVKRAVDLYKRACDQSYATGCYNLGLMYGNGRGVPEDLKRAADLYRRACDGGNAAACNNLGIQYANGRGVQHDDKRAADLYKRSCNAGDSAGCKNLARLVGQPQP